MNSTRDHHCRIRIRFAKNEALRFLGHRDFIRSLERIFRRAGLQLAMSQGFHPRPRMRFSDPLSVGQIGLDEVMDLVVIKIDNPLQLKEQLNRCSVAGLEFKEVDILKDNEKKLVARSFCYEVRIPTNYREQVAMKLNRFCSQKSYFVQRGGHGEAIDIRPLVSDLRLDGCRLQMQLRATQEVGVRPKEILELLDLSIDFQAEAMLTRTAVQL